MRRLFAVATPVFLGLAAWTVMLTGAQEKQEKEKIEQSPSTISVDVPMVNVDVVVTTRGGEPITVLKKEHFRVLEDGVPQEIAHFAPTDAPITLVIVMEFSKLYWEWTTYQNISNAFEFLKQLNKDDWVALVSYDLKPKIEVDFTKNKNEVQGVLGRMMFPGFTEASLYYAVIDTLDRLEGVEGKKAILILGTGYDTGLGKYTLDDALRRIKKTDVTIYSVGSARAIFEWLETRGYVGSIGRLDYLQAENNLRSFARMTGGKAWSPRFQGELPGIFREIVGSLRSQYSLGYTPRNQKRDGKFRKIKVELVGEDGKPLVIKDQNDKKVKYVIYAREGYIAPKGQID